MKYEDMVQEAWSFIRELGITEDQAEYGANPAEMYLVASVYQVRDAYVSDLENNAHIEDEDLPGFFERHGIEWK